MSEVHLEFFKDYQQTLFSMIIIITGVLSVLFITICYGEQTINTDTPLGTIKGMQMETRLGAKFWSFRGIRYAEPPVGELRFQNPQPVKAWQPNVFDATQDGPMCPQVTENKTAWISEDCLRLNVYTKDLNTANGLKPVIVFLHPGGFYMFSAISAYAGPENLLDRDIVLVTVNYRLASLGFMATGTADAPGNMGLKDQVIALRWIQSHIEKFGGDPKSVTLWGYSAGSISVGLHMISPMSKNLFHRAIMQSSSPISHYRYRSNQTELAERQARLLKCPVKPVRNMIECLKTKPMMDFVDTTAAMFDLDWVPAINWMPVVEPDGGQERFLAEDPYKTMLNGNLNKVPLITGITQYEFYNAAYYIIRNDTLREPFNQDFEKYVPIYLFYERESSKSRNISQAFRSFYFQNKKLEFPHSVESLGKLFTDLMCFEYHRFVEMASKHIPVYTYFYTYKNRYSENSDHTYGPEHHDELLYLLNTSLNTHLPTAPLTKTDSEINTIERLTRMWYEFAKKGDPNNPSDEYLKTWPPYDVTKKPYLEIGDELEVKLNGIFPQSMQLWDRQFPIQDMLNNL